MLVKVYSCFEKGRRENVQATIPKGNIECNNNQYIGPREMVVFPIPSYLHKKTMKQTTTV